MISGGNIVPSFFCILLTARASESEMKSPCFSSCVSTLSNYRSAHKLRLFSFLWL